MKKKFRILNKDQLQNIEGGYKRNDYAEKLIIKVYKKIFG